MKLKLDLREFERAAKQVGASADQVPFALSVAMNSAVKDTRKVLVERTWPAAVTVRNPGFMRAALRMKFATKRNLSVEIFDALGRAHLKEHAEGGRVRPVRGRTIAIPGRTVRRGAHGVSKSQKPRALRKAWRARDRILQKIGRRGRVRVMYLLRRFVRIKPDVPFHQDFRAAMRAGLLKHLPAAVMRAMTTRRT